MSTQDFHGHNHRILQKIGINRTMRDDTRSIVACRREQRQFRVITNATNGSFVIPIGFIRFHGQIQVEPVDLRIVTTAENVIAQWMNIDRGNPFSVDVEPFDELLFEEMIDFN